MCKKYVYQLCFLSFRKSPVGLSNRNDAELNQYVILEEYWASSHTFDTTAIQNQQPTEMGVRQSLIDCVQLHQSILKSCWKISLIHIASSNSFK